MSKRIALVMGFGAFAQDTVNPSERVSQALNGRTIGGVEVRGVVLPVDAARVRPIVRETIDGSTPEVVIALGYAAGRVCINLERVALNVLDFAIPDAAGKRPVGVSIVPGAPDARISSLPIATIESRLRLEGIPCAVSNTAGTYLCNEVMYLVLQSGWVQSGACRAGFMHLPALPSMEKALLGRIPSMSFDLMVRGVELAVLCSQREQ